MFGLAWNSGHLPTGQHADLLHRRALDPCSCTYPRNHRGTRGAGVHASHDPMHKSAGLMEMTQEYRHGKQSGGALKPPTQKASACAQEDTCNTNVWQ